MSLVNEIAKYYDSRAQQYHESSGYDKETSLATYREIKELTANPDASHFFKIANRTTYSA